MSNYVVNAVLYTIISTTESALGIPMLQKFVPFSCAMSSIRHTSHIQTNAPSLPTIKQHHQRGWYVNRYSKENTPFIQFASCRKTNKTLAVAVLCTLCCILDVYFEQKCMFLYLYRHSTGLWSSVQYGKLGATFYQGSIHTSESQRNDVGQSLKYA